MDLGQPPPDLAEVGAAGRGVAVDLDRARVRGLDEEFPLTTWCAIRARACWPGGLADWWLPFGGAVGDKAGDGHVGLIEVFAPSEVPLEGPPLLVLGVGVLDADPFR